MSTDSQPETIANPFEKGPRTWAIKFKESRQGLFYGLRTEKTFRFQVPAACLAIAAAAYLRCSPIEWCLVVMAIGLVLTAEMFNTAIEHLFHGLDAQTKATWNSCLVLASGGVLMAGIFALSVGAIVFGSKVAAML